MITSLDRRGTGRWALIALLALALVSLMRVSPAQAQALSSDYLLVSLSEAGELVVDWRGTPGNSGDWVSVVRDGAADDTYESTWTYTNGQVDGRYQVGRLEPGAYEARLYLDWPSGGYTVVDRLGFRINAGGGGLVGGASGGTPVAPASGGASRNLSVSLSASGEVLLAWRGTPGNAQDWVSIVAAGRPDDFYEATWSYTNGQVSGAYNAGRLAAGNYEARLYLNWPSGGYTVVDRLSFTVTR